MKSQAIAVGAIFALAFLLIGGIYALAKPLSGISFFRLKEAAPIEVGPPPFDPAVLSWEMATSSAAWRARDSYATFIFNEKLWIAGGLNGDDQTECVGNHCTTRYWEAPHFNDIWSSSDGVSWTRETEHAEWSPRRSSSIIEFNGVLFMYGGYAPDGGLATDIWQSLDGIHWEKVSNRAPFPPREGQTIEVWNGRLWLFGGVRYDLRQELNDVWYSEDGIAWVEVTEHAPWSPRWDHDTEIFNGKIYLAGGMDLTLNASNDVWVTEDGMLWTKLTEHAEWTPRQGGALIAFQNYLWVIGRLNDKDSGYGPNDVWYSADGVTWEKTFSDPLWPGREDGAAVLFKDRIYVFGGMAAVGEKLQWMNDVWISSK